jgi:hypothetical protein
MILNVLLLAVLALLVQQLRQEMELAKQRETAMLKKRVIPPSVPGLAPLAKVPPIDATAYQDTVTKNLFSRDRNPNPIPDPPPAPPPPQPPPPFPVARGVMIWGDLPPTIVLSNKGANDQRGYHPGEMIGEWKIAALDDKFIVLQWRDKEFKKRIDELMDRTPIQIAEPAPAAAPPAPAANKSLSESKSVQGAEMGAGVRACSPQDPLPNGTVMQGYKKVVSQTPFGSVCRWEPVQQ